MSAETAEEGEEILDSEVLAEGFVDEDGNESVKLTLTVSGEKIAALQTRHVDEMNEYRAALTAAFFRQAMGGAVLAGFQGQIPPGVWGEATDAIERRFSRSFSRHSDDS